MGDFKDRIKLQGKVTVRVFDAKSMDLLHSQSINNLVVNAGLQETLDLLFGLGGTAFGYCAVGSDNTAPAAGQTTLGDELARSIFDDCSRSAQVVTANTWFGASEGNGTWREGGIFNAASAGKMLARALFDPIITKDATKVVQVEWTVTASSS